MVNSARTELQVQEELDKKRFSTSAPRGRGATPYTETVEYVKKVKGRKRIYIAPLLKYLTLKALRYGSHSVTCNTVTYVVTKPSY